MALISNIHYNLAAWSAGLFNTGQRCASSGNAYQCVVAGSSSVAPSGTGTSINNGGTAVFKWLSPVDFTDLQTWANALPATLTQAVAAQLWNNGPITTTTGTPFLTLTGHTTSAVNNITITAAPGESFSGNGSSAGGFSSGYSSGYSGGNGAGGGFSSGFSSGFSGGGSGGASGSSGALAFNASAGVAFVLPSSGVGGINYVALLDNNVVVSGLQFQDPNAASGSTILQTAQTCTVQNCIFDGYGQDGGASIIDSYLGGSTSSVLSFLNNLVIDRAPNGAGFVQTVNNSYNAVFANNTFFAINTPPNVACMVDGSTTPGTSIKFVNNIILGYASGTGAPLYSNGVATIPVSYSLFSNSSVSTGTGVVVGSGNLYSKTAAATFVSAASNFRPLPSSSAVGAGTTDTADIPTATDIFGYPRPAGAWTIGAAQIVIPTSIGTFAGKANFSGTPSLAAVGRFAGSAAFQGTSKTAPNVGVGRFAGIATFTGVAPSISIGQFAGVATFQGYSGTAAVNASISLTNPGNQVVNTPFVVSGTYTIAPSLQFADDSSTTFTPIPQSGITALGTSQFSFVHPGIPVAGADALLVEDLATSASSATNYLVYNTPPPPNTPPPSVNPFSPGTSLSNIIPAYIYEQYADDDNIQAFASAYNAIAQAYLDWFSNINLPIWTGPSLTGPLLDWVATGIYGIPRPVLSLSTIIAAIGDFNTYDLNTIDIDGSGTIGASTTYVVTDDIYKRVLTWYLYKGDGFTFNTLWLKRRVARFLAGVNGTDYNGPTDQISVKFTGTSTINITVNAGAIELSAAPLLQAAILTGSVPLPFQYTFNMLIS